MNTRDLVIGLAALQLGKTDTTRLANTYQTYLAQGAADWLTNLTATGALSPDDAREIAAFAQQLVRACGNNEQAALDVLGGIEKARETFQNATPCSEPGNATLRQLIERTHTLAERSALLPLFTEACRIVAAMHARGTVHRNLQPGTILIDHTHSVAVLDWSAGRVRGKQDAMSDPLTQAVQHLRDNQAHDDALDLDLDPAYLAPELALGHIEDIDARSDVYALGAILYTLLTGKPPFTGERSSDIIHAVGSRKPEPVAAAQPAAPPELAAACERAMHQEPSARYASAKQLADELAHSLHAPAIRPRDRSTQPAWPYALLGACAMGLVTLIITFLYAGAANRSSEAFRSLAALEQKSNQTTEERDRLARDLEEAQRTRKQTEAERDQADEARARLQNSVKRSEEAQRKTESELAKAKEQKNATEPIAAEAKPPIPTAAPVAEQTAEPPAATNQHPPGLTKIEYAKDLPELIEALKEEPATDGKTSIVVRPEGADMAADLLRLQFKDGDIITNINRATVDSLEQARKILETLKQDPGFNVRILRNGQPSRMRVNVVDATPPPIPTAETPTTHTDNTKKGRLLITPQETRPLAPDEKPQEATESTEAEK